LGSGSIGLVASVPSDSPKSGAPEPLPQPPPYDPSPETTIEPAADVPPSAASPSLDVSTNANSSDVAGINVLDASLDVARGGVSDTTVYVAQSISDAAAGEVAKRFLPPGGNALFSILNLNVDLTRSPDEAPRTLFDFAADTAVEAALGGEFLIFAKASAPETIANDPFDSLSKLSPEQEGRVRQQLDDEAARRWSPPCPTPLVSCPRTSKTSSSSFQ
jgi:hypothetical protein